MSSQKEVIKIRKKDKTMFEHAKNIGYYEALMDISRWNSARARESNIDVPVLENNPVLKDYRKKIIGAEMRVRVELNDVIRKLSDERFCGKEVELDG